MLPEEIEQCKLFDWIRTIPELEGCAFHIANERKANPMRGLLLKRMGVLSGVSDIFIPIAKGAHHGLFIELKAGNNKTTLKQQAFLARMTLNGYLAVCCLGYEAARAVILTYLEKPCFESLGLEQEPAPVVFRCF